MTTATAGFKKGGVHPLEGKELSLAGELVEVEPPKMVMVPVTQHLGKPSICLVEKKADVKVGQVLAEPDGFISSFVHSPVSGKVLKVFDGPVVGVYRARMIQIMNNGKFEGAEEFAGDPRVDWGEKDSFLERIRLAGVVGMGGAAFPTNVKLKPPPDAPVDTLIINGCECEPYLTADDVLMRNMPGQVLAGARIMAGALGVDTILVGIENNKPRAIEAMTVAALEQACKNFDQGEGPDPEIKVVPLRTRYPQGAEKQLIDATLGRRVGRGKLPFAVGVVVQNVGTCVAVFEAVGLGKPLYERVMTVTGGAVAQPGNYKVKIGTPLQTVVDAAGGALPTLRAMVSGGPMMGKSLRQLEVPVVKGMSGLLMLTEQETAAHRERDCLRCGRCVDVCPMFLSPCDMAAAVEFKEYDLLSQVMDCVECGCCQYGCPSKRNIVQWMRLGKYHWRRKAK